MIRYKNEVFEDYFIDPETAIITDKDGNVQKTKVYKGRTYWKCREVYRIQMHTHQGYIPRKSIHHIDKNKLNDALSNLMYISNKEHTQLHKDELMGNYERTEEIKHKISNSVKQLMTDEYKKKISEWTKAGMTQEVKEKIRQSRLGKKVSEETREKLRNKMKGKIICNNGIKNIYADKDNIPEGFIKGKLKKQPKIWLL